MSVRHDWYQSDSKIVITVLLKNAVEKNYQVNIDREKVIMTADNYYLELNLYRPIDPSRSYYRATSSKVEITLAKETGERWESLEKKIEENRNLDPKVNQHKWDKLAKEITKQENEEAEGEEALQNLFKKIYSESSEEVKRAMNKSFCESGGTVLSTNWKEVGGKKVEVKPPNGTEYKKWES